MSRSRTLLLLLFSLGIAIQPALGETCACDVHSESASHAHSHHDADEMPAHADSTSEVPDSNDCSPEQTCDCGTCAGFIGLVFGNTELTTIGAAPGPIPPARYADPPTAPAYRPPIQAASGG